MVIVNIRGFRTMRPPVHWQDIGHAALIRAEEWLE
jgi:hypothetical protein